MEASIKVSVAPSFAAHAVHQRAVAPSHAGHAVHVRAELVLTPAAFACVWIATACLHMINGAFLGAACALYWYITTPDMEYFVPTLQLPSLLFLRLIGVAYATVSACHGLALASMVRSSLRRKRLCFDADRANPQAIHPRQGPDLSQRPVHRIERRRAMHRVASTVLKMWQSVFYMDGQYFELGFELREVLEVVCQTYQVFYLSRSVSSVWINALAVATLAINCVVTPCIHHLQRRRFVSVAEARMMCVMCDALLDFISSVVVPLAVFVPYWREFDSTTHDFANSKTYDEVWYTNAIQENRQLFVVTAMDFVSTMLPHISFLVCMKAIKRRVVQVLSTVPTRSLSIDPPSSSDQGNHKQTRWLQYLVMGWGACIVAAHLIAQHDPARVPSCKLHNNGWLLRGFPCVVLDLNCHRLGTTGSRDVLNNELNRLSRPSLQLLAVTHCPQLEMPSFLSEFPALKGLIVLNSTIVDWEEHRKDAVIKFDYLEFIAVNFSGSGELPSALTSGRVVVQDLEIFDSNLTELPANIDALWPALMTLYVEFAALEAIPLAVFRLKRIQFLSFVGNQIRTLPDDAFAPPHASELRYLTLSNNPLDRLPPHITDQSTFGIQELDIENTLITELPLWAELWLTQCADCMTAFGSPWCETESNTSLAASLRIQSCSEDRDTSSGLMPVNRIASQHGMT